MINTLIKLLKSLIRVIISHLLKNFNFSFYINTFIIIYIYKKINIIIILRFCCFIFFDFKLKLNQYNI